jgi:membrane associated rhomboid family serine protease
MPIFRSDLRYAAGSGHGTQRRETSLAKAIIMVTVTIYLLQMSGRDGYMDRVTAALGLEYTLSHQWWRYVTYLFCHGSLLHLGLNMWALFLFGPVVERRIGKPLFGVMYLAAGVLGALLWMWLQGRSGAVLIGASGSVYGVVGAAIALFPMQRVLLLLPPMPMKLRTLGCCLLVFEFSMLLFNPGSPIAHLAHLGGFFVGLGFILGPKRVADLADRRAYAKLATSDIDAALDKLATQGPDALSPAERGLLAHARDRLSR